LAAPAGTVNRATASAAIVRAAVGLPRLKTTGNLCPVADGLAEAQRLFGFAALFSGLPRTPTRMPSHG
jgi:hypothetical protein